MGSQDGILILLVSTTQVSSSLFALKVAYCNYVIPQNLCDGNQSCDSLECGPFLYQNLLIEFFSKIHLLRSFFSSPLCNIFSPTMNIFQKIFGPDLLDVSLGQFSFYFTDFHFIFYKSLLIFVFCIGEHFIKNFQIQLILTTTPNMAGNLMFIF